MVGPVRSLIVGSDGQTLTAELRTGEGVRATAAIAAETTQRVLAGVKAGAWSVGQLFGAALVTDATGAQVTLNRQPASLAAQRDGEPATGSGSALAIGVSPIPICKASHRRNKW